MNSCTKEVRKLNKNKTKTNRECFNGSICKINILHEMCDHNYVNSLIFAINNRNNTIDNTDETKIHLNYDFHTNTEFPPL